MRILQPAEWSKPRGFSHGVEVDGPGRWIVLAGQTGGDEKGDYSPDMAAQVALYRGAGRLQGQGRNRSHRLRAQGVKGVRAKTRVRRAKGNSRQ
jgi:hypothetical protein